MRPGGWPELVTGVRSHGCVGASTGSSEGHGGAGVAALGVYLPTQFRRLPSYRCSSRSHLSVSPCAPARKAQPCRPCSLCV